MPTSRQRSRERYDMGARAYAVAANMLEGVDREEWKARDLSHGDVLLAPTMGVVLLRVNSIELGLKHILDAQMKRQFPKKHDLAILRDLLTDGWKEDVAKATGSPIEDIRETLGHYKGPSVALRYGGPLGEQNAQPPAVDRMRRQAVVLQRVANALGGQAHQAFELEKVKPGSHEG